MTAPASQVAVRRSSLRLDDGWSFVGDPSESLVPASVPAGPPIVVPGAWEDLIGGVGGLSTGWYRRTLDIPADWRGDRIAIRFGAVMERCDVWLDARRVGSHVGGYTPFEVKLDGDVADGRPHELLVRARNPFGALDAQPAYTRPGAMARAGAAFGDGFLGIPGGKQTWYTATSGIVRPVTIERRPDVHLARLRIRPNLAQARVSIRWGVVAGMGGRDQLPRTLAITVIDPAGAIGGEWNAEDILPGASGEITIELPDPIAWDIGRPELYEVRAVLEGPDGASDDLATARFGMRDVTTDDGRILLNGRPVYLLGALDQDFYPDTRSTPPSRAFLDAQLVRARELGLNLLRCHITVPDDRYLDAADEAGMLLWCELPNWNEFSHEAGDRGIAVLEDIIEALDDHPSVVAWTIINEDWGTDVRHDAAHRGWLSRAYARIRALDPTRLVIDNSACGRAGEENFHLQTDLADFHVYHLTPDHADQWRDRIAEFASRPAWLWSPAGDALPRGDEPLVLSEFGSWGLPDLQAFEADEGLAPWWFATGPPEGIPGDMPTRVERFGLDRVFDGYAGLIRATQEHQWEALRYEIAELRRHSTITGYVITEFSDIYWEANGLLDMRREPKAFHDRFAAINAPDVVVAELAPRDRLGGERVRIPVTVSAWADGGSTGGHVLWKLLIGANAAGPDGRLDFDGWPSASARVVGTIGLELPDVARPSRASLEFELLDAEGRRRASAALPFAILPREIGGLGGLDRGALAAGLGVHVATRLDAGLVERLRVGERVLLLAGGGDAGLDEVELPESVVVHPREAEDPADPTARPVWQGDWISTFAWLRSEALADLSDGRCLDLAFQRVLPHHVLLGHTDDRTWDDVSAGLFAGWVHSPAAITWSMPVGAGRLTVTTFHLEPGRGPVADALFAELVRSLADHDHPQVPEESQ